MIFFLIVGRFCWQHLIHDLWPENRAMLKEMTAFQMRTAKEEGLDLASSPQALKRGRVLEQQSLRIDTDIKLCTEKESGLADTDTSEIPWTCERIWHQLQKHEPGSVTSDRWHPRLWLGNPGSLWWELGVLLRKLMEKEATPPSICLPSTPTNLKILKILANPLAMSHEALAPANHELFLWTCLSLHRSAWFFIKKKPTQQFR